MVKIIKKEVERRLTVRNIPENYQKELEKIPPRIRTVTNPDIYHKTLNNHPALNPNRRQNGWEDLRPTNIDIDIYNNTCNKSIQISLRILIWRTPRIELLQRIKECRLEDSDLKDYTINCLPSPKCKDGEKAVYIWQKNFNISYQDELIIDNTVAAIWEIEEYTTIVDKVSFPQDKYVEDNFGNELKVYAQVEYTNIISYTSNYDTGTRQIVEETFTERETYKTTDYFIEGSRIDNMLLAPQEIPFAPPSGSAYLDYDEFVKNTPTSQRRIEKYFDTTPTSTTISTSRKGIAGKTVNPYRTIESNPISFYYDALGFKVIQFKRSTNDKWILNEENWTALTFCEDGKIFAGECILPPKKPPPPPPKMRCCPDNSAILKEILKIVKQNKEAIGYDSLPADLPASFILENNKSASQEKKANLVEIMGWLSERIDEVTGQFELEIEVEDSNATEKGNQTVSITLPNIAESLGEIIMLLMSILYDADLNVNLNSKILTEVGSSKVMGFKNNQAIDTIIDYLGYGIKQVKEDLPMSFTPGAETFDELIKPKNIKVPVDELDDSRILPTIFQELLHAAAITRAVHFRRVDPGKDIPKQIIDDINNQEEFINKVSIDGEITDNS